VEDPELNAMSVIASALSVLEPDTVKRVLDWATRRFVALPVAPAGVASASHEGTVSKFDDFPSLFDAANPQTAADKALVVGYWFQVVDGQDDFDGFALNTELKHLGHASTNITRDLDALMSRTPRFVLQVRKSGTTKQARKQYKLTREGIRYVQELLARAHSRETAV
jgi:hypothetical protein